MAIEKELMEGISLIAQGKEEGFNILYSHTYNYVYSRAKYIMKDEQDALDLTQETFIHAYKGINTLEDVDNVYAWLGGIVYRQGMRIFRKKREILVDEEAAGIFEDIIDEDRDSSPEETTDARATAEIVMGLIEGLPELQRAAVLAYYYDNMKIEDIAKVYGCSANTIKSRLNYAKKYLKAKVEEDEKKNRYKLRSVSPAIMLLAFRALFAEENYIMPQTLVQGIYNGSCNAVGLAPKPLPFKGAVNAAMPTDSGKAAFGTDKAAAAGRMGTAIGLKAGIAIGAVAVAVVAGIAVYFSARKEEPLQNAIVQEEASIISKTVEQEIEMEETAELTEVNSEEIEETKEAETKTETETEAGEEETTTFVGELDPAELTWRDTTAERGLYEPDEDWENMKNGMPPNFVIGSKWVGETIDEIIQMYNDPSLEMPDVATFLNAGYGSGKCSGMTYESLKWLKENGYTTLYSLVTDCTDNVYVCIPHMLPDMPASIDSELQKEIDEREAFFEKMRK